MQPVESAVEAPGALTVQRLDRRPVDAVQLDVVRAVATGTEVADRERAIIAMLLLHVQSLRRSTHTECNKTAALLHSKTL